MNFEELMLRAVTNAETFKYTAKPVSYTHLRAHET